MKCNDLFKNVTHVWFDLDDTLIDFKTNSRTALTKLYEREKLSQWFLTPQEWIECYEKYNHQLWADYAQAKITREELIEERFCLPFIEAGAGRTEALQLSSRLHEIYLDALAAEKKLVRGAEELLKILRGRGYRIGVLSNGFTEVQYRKINSAGLSQYFDYVVLSDNIGINKPDSRIFRYAESVSGESDISKHILIGDNPATDIAGAIGAGWKAIWYNKSGEMRNEIIDVPIVASLDEIRLPDA